MVAMKIRYMNDNKSHGVDEIRPKLLLEIVEQISTQLATEFNLSLEERIVPLESKVEQSAIYNTILHGAIFLGINCRTCLYTVCFGRYVPYII